MRLNVGINPHNTWFSCKLITESAGIMNGIPLSNKKFKNQKLGQVPKTKQYPIHPNCTFWVKGNAARLIEIKFLLLF